jgi:hypothetical protein
VSRAELLLRARQLGDSARAWRKLGRTYHVAAELLSARAELAAWHAARMPA